VQGGTIQLLVQTNLGRFQISSTSDSCMVRTRAQAMANERIDNFESQLKYVLLQLKKLNETLSKDKMEEHAEAYIGNENIEGESSQSLHLFGTQQQS